MPLYLISKPLTHRYIEIHPVIVPKEEDKKNQLIEILKMRYRISETELVMCSAMFVILREKFRKSLPKGYTLYLISDFVDECKVVLNCSEDEFMIFKLSDNSLLSDGYEIVAEYEIEHKYGLIR